MKEILAVACMNETTLFNILMSKWDAATPNVTSPLRKVEYRGLLTWDRFSDNTEALEPCIASYVKRLQLVLGTEMKPFQV